MAEERAELEARLSEMLAKCVEGFRELQAFERLSGGASQETYRLRLLTVDGKLQLALRRAPGGGGVSHGTGPGLATEALLMQRAREAGVPEPRVLHVLEPADGLGEGFLMEWLEGETLGARIVRAPELEAVRPRLARQCGEILARIHAIDLTASGLEGRLQRLSPRSFVEQSWNTYQAFDTPQPMIDYAARWLLEHLPPETDEPRLVHNDFRNGNLMIGPEGVVAVLDWEIAHVGDPMRDLGWLCTASWRFGGKLPVGGFGTREDLFAGYEAASGHPVDPARVHFWEVFGSFWWAVGCLGMAQHYRSGPDKTVERPGIGRRSSECQVDCVNLLIPGPVELVEPTGGDAVPDMPRIDELVTSVRDFLRGDVMGATQGRTRFLARVAGNSLDVVLRDLALGEAHRARELERLRALFASDEGLAALRWRLTRALRDEGMLLDHPGLAEHLRATVVNQLAIDQPKYPGLKTALAGGG